jgi:hypothetical protein
LLSQSIHQIKIRSRCKTHALYILGVADKTLLAATLRSASACFPPLRVSVSVLLLLLLLRGGEGSSCCRGLQQVSVRVVEEGRGAAPRRGYAALPTAQKCLSEYTHQNRMQKCYQQKPALLLQ